MIWTSKMLSLYYWEALLVDLHSREDGDELAGMSNNNEFGMRATASRLRC